MRTESSGGPLRLDFNKVSANLNHPSHWQPIASELGGQLKAASSGWA